jgi:hypothetical protein
MAGGTDGERRRQSGHDGQPGREEWPAWLDGDDFDGLGEEAWRAAMAARDEEPLDGDAEPAGQPGDEGCPDSAGQGSASQRGSDWSGGDWCYGGGPGDADVPVLGFGIGEAGE